jgi:hypothetical protein
VAVGLAVGLGTSGEVMALNHAGKALALGNAGDINQVAFLKQANVNLIAYFDLFGIVKPELLEVAEAAQFFKVPFLGGV